MAKSVAEFIFNRYFFPGMKERKIAHYKELFMKDMQFNLSTGEAYQTTVLFNDSYEKVSKVFVDSFSVNSCKFSELMTVGRRSAIPRSTILWRVC